MYTLEKFTKAVPVDQYMKDYLDIEGFEAFCKECPNYGKLWSCPPYDFNVENFWKQHETLQILGYKINFEEGTSGREAMDIMKDVKDKISLELFEMEEKTPGSVSLCAGSCSWCEKENCTRLCGEKCRHEEKMRYSLESLGANVGKTVSEALGIKLQWVEEGKVPDYFVLVGGLLE